MLSLFQSTRFLSTSNSGAEGKSFLGWLSQCHLPSVPAPEPLPPSHDPPFTSVKQIPGQKQILRALHPKVLGPGILTWGLSGIEGAH
jgi:hypothetical protein